MECKFCQAANSDDAVYCKKCGKRIDGKKNCPSCGTVIEEDSVFCNACGARVDGKIVCKTCGTVYEGAYCPQCGIKTQTVGAKEQRKSAAHAKTAINPRKILNFVSLGLVIAVAVLSIIFVCLIGVTVDAQGTVSESTGIFDYFGKTFKEIKDSLNSYDGVLDYNSSGYKDSLYLPAIFGLISVLVSFVGTLAFAITGAAKSILNIVKKNGKNTTVWALLAFVFYMFGVSMIMSVNAASATASVSWFIVEVKVVFNGATIAGIVLGTIMLACLVGCDTTVYFMNERPTTSKIVERTLTVVVAVCAVIVVAMLASPVATVILKGSYYGEPNLNEIEVSLGSGLFSLFSTFLDFNTLLKSDLSQSKADNVSLMETYVILGQVFIFIAIFAALLFFVAVLSKDRKSSRCLSIVSSGIFLAAALVALIATVLAGGKFVSVTSKAESSPISGLYDPSYSMTYAPVIVALVFAVIAFAANICRVVFVVKNRETPKEISVEEAK